MTAPSDFFLDAAGNTIDAYGNLQNSVAEISHRRVSVSTLTDGQNTTITTTASQVLVTSTPCVEVLIQADPANTQNIAVGGASPKIVLTAGQSIVLPVRNVNQVYAKSVSGTQTVNFLARG